jgi:hypothetical protein
LSQLSALSQWDSAAKVACAHEPTRFEELTRFERNQYFNCLVRRL